MTSKKEKKKILSRRSKSYSTPWFESASTKGLKFKMRTTVRETVSILSLCSSCKHFKPNKPNTPIFINGFWWGGPDAGLCKREIQEYDDNQHRIDSDSCKFHEFHEHLNTFEIPEPW